MTKSELIQNRKNELINEFGNQSDEVLNNMLLTWFTQEFFNGEITKAELDEYAAEMGYKVEFGISCEDASGEDAVATA